MQPTTRQFPGYTWDSRLGTGGRYRRLSDGHIVSSREIVGLLNLLSDASSKRLADLAEAVVRDRLDPRSFQLATMYELNNLYFSLGALAAGGWPRFTHHLEQIVRAELIAEFSISLPGFIHDLSSKLLSIPEARARAALYVGKAYSIYWKLDRLLKQGGISTPKEEAWIQQTDERTCQDCIKFSAMGWVPFGTFPTVPGEGKTACLGACRCTIEYR